MLNDIQAFSLQLVSSFLRVSLRLCRQSWLILNVHVGGNDGRFSDPGLFRLLVCLYLQLIDVEASELCRQFVFTTLSKPKKAFLIKNDVTSEPLLIIVGCAIDLTCFIAHAKNHHEHVSQVIFTDTFTLFSFHENPKLLEQLVVRLLFCHSLLQKAHRCQD